MSGTQLPDLRTFTVFTTHFGRDHHPAGQDDQPLVPTDVDTIRKLGAIQVGKVRTDYRDITGTQLPDLRTFTVFTTHFGRIATSPSTARLRRRYSQTPGEHG